MNIFMQGMRRSGTTIVFDVLWQDPRLDSYYEPLAAAKANAFGGGSGATSIDYFSKVRKERDAFVYQYPDELSTDLLNYGAPRDSSLEFEHDHPEFVKDYIEHLTMQQPRTVVKFTRMYNKLGALHEIDKDAKFIQLLRDPRAVVSSYLFGKGQRNKRLYSTEKDFFTRKSSYSAWSSFDFSEKIIALEGLEKFKNCPDFIRILLIWKHTFRSTYEGAKKYFSGNFLMLKNEDLRSSPVAALERLYDHIDLEPNSHVFNWAKENIKPCGQVPYPDSHEWLKAFEELGMMQMLELAGYGHLFKIKANRGPN